ncbi:MAG: ISAzo13 family transposase, partial [Magnetococcales bacterium]|nr:ISAzo13 family transposase [Magnetococcales bacterium]
QLQKLADELQIIIHVCHLPPGTSKWNKIEHRMFCHITNNWRGRPLLSREVVVNLIGNTTTETGLRIQSQLDENVYEAGIKVSDQELEELVIERDQFHGEWNYRLMPRK